MPEVAYPGAQSIGLLESSPDVSNVGESRLARIGGQICISADGGSYLPAFGIGTTRYLAEANGINRNNTGAQNAAAIQGLWNQIRNSGRGGEVLWDGGTYDCASGLTDNYTGTTAALVNTAIGTAGVRLRASGGLVTAGDMLTLNQSKYFIMRDFTFSSTSVRSVGTRMIVVNGGMDVNSVPSQDPQFVVFERCNSELQFDGVLLQDTDASHGVVGFHWNGPSYFRRYAAGGNCFDFFTNIGVMINIDTVTHTETAGVASASRPNSTMRVRALADARIFRLESVFARNCLLITPSAGKRCNTLWLTDCILGAASDTCVLIDPDPASTEVYAIKSLNGWVDSVGGYIVNPGGASKVHALQIEDLEALGCTGDVVRLNGVQSANVSMKVAGCARGLYATGNSKNFRAEVNVNGFQGATTEGARIDAGCNNFNLSLVGAKTFATTPLTDNSGAVDKTVTNN